MSKNSTLTNEEGLSQREVEILTLVAEGLTNLEIGERLGIHRDSVLSHLRDSFKKISATNRLKPLFRTTIRFLPAGEFPFSKPDKI
jgi:DNA-binding CsgD family transcriptional regulator